jgi:hypothetical protein
MAYILSVGAGMMGKGMGYRKSEESKEYTLHTACKISPLLEGGAGETNKKTKVAFCQHYWLVLASLGYLKQSCSGRQLFKGTNPLSNSGDAWQGTVRKRTQP